MASPIPVTETDAFNQYKFLYAAASEPSISYLYGDGGDSYRYDDPEMGNFSFLSPLEIDDKKVIFTLFHEKLAH